MYPLPEALRLTRRSTCQRQNVLLQSALRNPFVSCRLLLELVHIRLNYVRDVLHKRHECECSGLCPIQCELCQRLCANRDHFHGLGGASPHLCGSVVTSWQLKSYANTTQPPPSQPHDCSHLCASDGICQVDVRPEKVETVFGGPRGTFQYTKVFIPCV